MALSDDETRVFQGLKNQLEVTSLDDDRHLAYYEGQQRLEHMGIAVPPELRRFETVLNWARSYLDALRARLRMRALFLPGEETADAGLREGYEANNLDSESALAHLDAFIYGRSFVTVGTNEDDKEHPLISVESPRQMTASVDPRRRRLGPVLRLYSPDDTGNARLGTLYLPDETVWLERTGDGRWTDYDRDQHRLGRPPVVMLLNRRRAGMWSGVSEMADLIPLIDAAARTLTNAGVAMETHAVPQKWVLGMSKGDFVDADGSPIPAWQSYFGAIWANQKGPKEAEVGQFTASDMANFERIINLLAQQASGLTGLPMRYFGQNTANPPSADGIRADESRLIRSAEMKADEFGDPWGWVFALYERFRTGEWVDGNRIKVDWYDPATPTKAQQADAAVKMRQVGALSRRGLWTELGWSQARIDQEVRWLEEEANDPLAERIAREFQAGVTDAAAAGD